MSKAGDLTRPPGSANLTPTCSHWGNYLIETDVGVITAVHPYGEDPNPSPIGQSPPALRKRLKSIIALVFEKY